jgi:hypothetical protein
MFTALYYLGDDDLGDTRAFMLDSVDLVAEHSELMTEFFGLQFGVYPFA